MDFASTYPELATPLETDSDVVRAARRLICLYADLYLRRSDPHRVMFVELAKRTLRWVQRGCPLPPPYLSREDIRKALEKANVTAARQTIDGVLREIALNLSILGFPLGTAAQTRSADYTAIDRAACTFVLDGVPRVVYLAGPTPKDRGEREKQDALFLELRVDHDGDGTSEPVIPALFRFDPHPFARVDLRCQLATEGLDTAGELRNIFAAIPLMLHGPDAVLQIEQDAGDEESVDQEWIALEGGGVRVEGSEHAFAEATIIGYTDGTTLDGGVELYPAVEITDLVPVFRALPPALVTRFGFKLELPFPTGLSHEDVIDAMTTDTRLFAAATEALRRRGTIIRRDPSIGDVIAVSPSIELGIWSDWMQLTVTFQRVGDRPLLPDIGDYLFASLLSDILVAVDRTP